MWQCGLLLVLVAILAGCAFPQDPEHTTERVLEEGVIRVGIIESWPWVVRNGEPAGIEVELVRRFADTMDAGIEWKWGDIQEHMEALEYYELDLVIGGITDSTPWRTRVALTNPYYTSQYLVAVPPGMPLPTELQQGLPVAVVWGSALVHELEEKGAAPIRVEDLTQVDGPVVAADWQIARWGLVPTDIVIHEARHVMAVPPGENRWLIRLDNFLHQHSDEVYAALVQGD